MRRIHLHINPLIHIFCLLSLIACGNELFPQKNISPDKRENKYTVFFGDLHNHTELSDGTGTPEKAYDYVRNKARFDFFAVTVNHL